MQIEFFEKEEVKKPTAGLIIGKPQKDILTKQQQAFNKLVKKIERLRLELAQVSKSMDEKLEFYGKHIYPLEQQLTELTKECTKVLYSFFENKKLLQKKEKQSLGKIISSQLNQIFSSQPGDPDDELKKIFKDVEGFTYEEAQEEDFNLLKNDMEAMFEEFGFKMNFDDLHSNMTQEEILKKAFEMEEQVKEQVNEKEKKQTSRKKKKAAGKRRKREADGRSAYQKYWKHLQTTGKDSSP